MVFLCQTPMNKYLRRGLIGMTAGLLAALPLAVTQETVFTGILLAILTGAAYAIVFSPTREHTRIAP